MVSRETVISGIGQGFWVTTPLQLAAATTATARRGNFIEPHFSVLEDVDAGAPVPLGTSMDWERMIDAMEGVLHGETGTARDAARGLNYRIAGKTGTAQVVSIGQEEEYDADEIEERFRDHALFVGFAPADAPRIVVALIIENGGSGSATAAPAARKVFDYWLLDRNGGASRQISITSQKLINAFSNQNMLTATETGHIESFKPKRFAQRYGVDPLLTLFILITAFYGLIILYSASGQSLSMVLRQGAHVIVGIAIMALLSQVRRDVIIQVTPFVFLFAALLLVAVLLIGAGAKGAQRWLDLPGLPRFQPAELMKLALPAMVAWWLTRQKLPPSISQLVIAAGLIVVPVALIAKQPDLGTSIIIAGSGFLRSFSREFRGDY